MLTAQSFGQTIQKLNRFCETLQQKLFIPVGQAEYSGFYQTTEPLTHIPDSGKFGPVPPRWGAEGAYGWFLMRYIVPAHLEGKALFLYPHSGFYEGTLWVNGRIHSNYAAKFIENSHGNHWCNRFTACAHTGEEYAFALELYAWHDMPGTQPLTDERYQDYSYPVRDTLVCTRDDEIFEFLFDLKTLLSLYKALPDASFRKAQLINALYETHLLLYYDPDACSPETFLQGLRAAAPFLKEQLAKQNGDSVPLIGLTGHSHMDTAWLWPLTETRKKCARTYANTLNLMEEYPEYRFVQSSALHASWLLEDDPDLFKRIQEAVETGRYEPNGGVWVECDCNVTGAEYLVRQFVWGQRFTQKYFHYTADTFWLPDTFGYSFSIPQIMQGCGIRYFLTTKMAWNDTNPFPLTSFYWQGLDGSKVLTHLNCIHSGPDPECFAQITADKSFGIREKSVSPMRLLSFGRGDGGGGPEFEMLETARRLENLEGVAQSQYMSVSAFMHKLETTLVRPTTYAGELYLELHRGTLTNQHTIKRNNRLCEIALHNLELFLVQTALLKGLPADEAPAAPFVGSLLLHQFHDILPGTCIHSVHEETRNAVGMAIKGTESLSRELLKGTERNADIRLYNPLSFDRNDTLHIEGDHSFLSPALTQVYTDINGQCCTAIRGLTLPAFGSAAIVRQTEKTQDASDPFILEDNCITTPFARLRLSKNGAIESFVDLRTGRELVDGLPFNTFLMTEDVPAAWDNWDIDADEEEKFKPVGTLLSSEIISKGAVEIRLRSKWQLTEKTTLLQDMVLDASSPLVTFETLLDWQDDHRFLKTAFDTVLQCDGVRNEIQFGHIRRSNQRSTSEEKARFEVCNHKFSDMSEAGYGIALLNDCKYGISVQGGRMRLSLHKGGLRPDDQGDHGLHAFQYALLPHMGSFSAETVVRPAYAFNYAPVCVTGGMELSSLCHVDAGGVIIETVKPCEDTQMAYILRLYEAEGGYCRCNLSFSHPIKKLAECNMLEEEQNELPLQQPLVFTPFQIRTVKVFYG